MVVQKSGSERLSKILYITLTIVFCILIYYCTKEIDRKKAENRASVVEIRLRPLFDAVYVMGLLTISLIPMMTPEYWRFAHVTLLFAGPVYLYTDKLQKENTRDEIVHSGIHLLLMLMQVLMVGCCMVWVRNISQSDRLYLILNPFFSSPIATVFRCLFRKALIFLGII